MEVKSDLAFLHEAADQNLCYDADDESGFADYCHAPEFHFVGNIEGSGSMESDTDPELILPALQTGVDSEAGSVDTAPMEEDTESNATTSVEKSPLFVVYLWQKSSLLGMKRFPRKTHLLTKRRTIRAYPPSAKALRTRRQPEKKRRRVR